MENVTYSEVETPSGLIETHAIIEHADGSFTSMLKSLYDAQVEHLTEIIPADEA